ncbi:hypothetical protein [Tessaracoccus caeni]|uniref:hypothetical protein n=1 Tax=Tessaracoccus caeni TaxID=3031239 RepID=UPI0023DAE729|nr:hypothetical protein [Tessaracoccus caeni]MDF1488278.1 hypothetical protein [Tessaracoccus caeni]
MSVVSETFLLTTHTVRDLEDLVAHPEKYLLSIWRELRRCADIWRDRATRHPFGGEGVVSLRYDGRELIRPDLWDDTSGIWRALVDAVEGFLAAGVGSAWFPGQPVPVRLERKGRDGAMLTIGEDRFFVDPQALVPGVLDEAEQYFLWVQEYVGSNESDALDQIRRLRGESV